MKNLVLIAALVWSVGSFAKVVNIYSSKGKVGFEIVKYKIATVVSGKFEKFGGAADFTESSKTLRNIKAVVDVKSVNTESEKRDRHLRSPDFFNVEKKGNEKMTYSSTGSTSLSNGKGKINGKLTLNGITKSVPLELVYEGMKKGFYHIKGTAQIDKRDFGIVWNKPMDKKEVTKKMGIFEKLASKFKNDVVGKQIIGEIINIELDIYLK